MNLPPVEWNPGLPGEQREKFLAAFDREWDYTKCHSEEDVRSMPRPGESPDHVIDVVTEGRLVGVRIIASREKQPAGEYLHISASLHHTSLSGEETNEALEIMWHGLGLSTLGRPVHGLLSAGNISHWFFRVPQWVRERASKKGAAQP